MLSVPITVIEFLIVLIYTTYWYLIKRVLTLKNNSFHLMMAVMVIVASLCIISSELLFLVDQKLLSKIDNKYCSRYTSLQEIEEPDFSKLENFYHATTILFFIY
jgi:hypothetical protein